MPSMVWEHQGGGSCRTCARALKWGMCAFPAATEQGQELVMFLDCLSTCVAHVRHACVPVHECALLIHCAYLMTLAPRMTYT